MKLGDIDMPFKTVLAVCAVLLLASPAYAQDYHTYPTELRIEPNGPGCWTADVGFDAMIWGEPRRITWNIVEACAGGPAVFIPKPREGVKQVEILWTCEPHRDMIYYDQEPPEGGEGEIP